MSGPPGLGLPPPARPPAVAGLFYPAHAEELGALVDELVAVSERRHPTPSSPRAASIAGILVPHAGLVYSGIVAAAGWRAATASLAPAPSPASPREPAAPTIVLLGTNHGAAWLDGVGAWDGGPWRTPLGEVAADPQLTRAIVDLGPPFAADARCHLGEHSLEVQLPFVARLAPGTRIVALSVGTGTGRRGVEAGARLGAMLASRRAAGERILLAISTDMAHYPAAAVAERVTAVLLPHILALDPESLADGGGRAHPRGAGRLLRNVRHRARRAWPRGAPRDGRAAGDRPRRRHVRRRRRRRAPDGRLPVRGVRGGLSGRQRRATSTGPATGRMADAERPRRRGRTGAGAVDGAPQRLPPAGRSQNASR